MKCENDFCAFWDNNVCLRGDITISRRGVCKSCVYVMTDSEDLKRLREETKKTLDGCDEITKKLIEVASY